MASALVPLTPATDVAFFAIFGIFVVAMVVLAVLVIVWAVRHDLAGRKASARAPAVPERAVPAAAPGRTVSTPVLSDGTVTATWSARLRGRWAQRRRATGGPRGPAPQRTAFVLAGGGSRGAVQVGMLGELLRRGILADRVFGASVGAINGASYAGNPTLEGIERMATIWRDVKGTDIFPRSTFDGPWAFLQTRAAVHANSGLRASSRRGSTTRTSRTPPSRSRW